jgi:hypothetical protein
MTAARPRKFDGAYSAFTRVFDGYGAVTVPNSELGTVPAQGRDKEDEFAPTQHDEAS